MLPKPEKYKVTNFANMLLLYIYTLPIARSQIHIVNQCITYSTVYIHHFLLTQRLPIGTKIQSNKRKNISHPNFQHT